jgi:hypothetical protein
MGIGYFDLELCHDVGKSNFLDGGYECIKPGSCSGYIGKFWGVLFGVLIVDVDASPFGGPL